MAGCLEEKKKKGKKRARDERRVSRRRSRSVSYCFQLTRITLAPLPKDVGSQHACRTNVQRSTVRRENSFTVK